MARILLSTYMVRYPLGGMLSWALQYLAGFRRLGHDVYLIEKADYADACFDPGRGRMSDDSAAGVRAVGALLERFGLGDRWCFVDASGRHHGLDRPRLRELLRTADVLVDGGNHGAWLADVGPSCRRVLIDGEPAWTQMKWAQSGEVPEYDHYFTNGLLLARGGSTAPRSGRQWLPLPNPVVIDDADTAPPPQGAAYTTVMNWRSHPPIRFGGRVYGQKDVEFTGFLDLPRRVGAPLEAAVAGAAPREALLAHGWRVRSAHDVTTTYGAYHRYLRRSRGEFSVCKNVFVATRSGWFSDRSAAYLAAGRPVVLQDTGFSAVLPVGAGLFAVRDVEEAAAAIDAIETDYRRHAEAARALAAAHLSADKVLGGLLDHVLPGAGSEACAA